MRTCCLNLDIRLFLNFFGGGLYRACLLLLVVVSVAAEVPFKWWNLSLFTKLWKSCLSVYQVIWYGVGTKLGPLENNDLQALESSLLLKLTVFWSGQFVFADSVTCLFLSSQFSFLYLLCLFRLLFLNFLFLHADFILLMRSLWYFLKWRLLISAESFWAFDSTYFRILSNSTEELFSFIILKALTFSDFKFYIFLETACYMISLMLKYCFFEIFLESLSVASSLERDALNLIDIPFGIM